MRKILLTFGLFISMDALCYIDTIPLTATITSVKVLPEGTWIKRQILVNLTEGEYVLQLKGFPLLEEKDLNIDQPRNIDLLSVESKSGNSKNVNWNHFNSLQGDIDILLQQLKQLESDEKNLLELKRLSQSGRNNGEKLNDFKTYFHQQGAEIRKERLANYQKLIQLKEQLNVSTSKIPFNQGERIHELYIHVAVLDTVMDTIHISYLLKPAQLENQQADLHTSKNQSVHYPFDLKGKVITNNGLLPLTAVEVELYDQNQLMYSTVTDQEGNFSLSIQKRGDYRLIIKTEGYQRRKIKQLLLNQASNQPYLIQLREKMSFLEFLSYALPTIDIVSSVVK